MSKAIPKSTFDFLTELKDPDKNQREWFNEHKPRYQEAHETMIEFATDLLDKMRQHDDIATPTGKKSLFRIYRDVRFSKNKAPYKSHMSGSFGRTKPLLRGGYYFHVEPGASMIAGGFWQPNKDDLLRIRKEIAGGADEFREVFNDPTFISTFGSIEGAQLKTAPKGFPKDHPEIKLLRYKSFTAHRNFSDKEVMSEGFADLVNESFKALRPFFDLFSEVLTTDENGVPLHG